MLPDDDGGGGGQGQLSMEELKREETVRASRRERDLLHRLMAVAGIQVATLTHTLTRPTCPPRLRNISTCNIEKLGMGFGNGATLMYSDVQTHGHMYHTCMCACVGGGTSVIIEYANTYTEENLGEIKTPPIYMCMTSSVI